MKKKVYRTTFNYNGKRYDVRAKSNRELQEKVAQKKNELEVEANNRSNQTLNRYYFDQFTENRRNELNESTIRTQKNQYKLIASTIYDGKPFGEIRIQDITRQMIELVRQTLLDDGKTPEHLNNCFSHLNHVFNEAVKHDLIVKNPCTALKQLRRAAAPVGETKHRALSEEETRRFMETARERQSYYYNCFALMLSTGLRVGEMSALYRTDIDRQFIHVRRTITRDEIGQYVVGDTAKTRSGIRDVPVTAEVLRIIQNQEELNQTIFNGTVGLIFRSVEGEILREYQVNREIKRICEAANIDVFTCHAFRNTFATRFIEQRPGDYKILSEILGHKDVSITLNLYTHVMTEKKCEAMNSVVINMW